MVATERVTYAGYLRLHEILGAQHPLAPVELGPQVHAAEHFFIVVHQTFELWFKQVLLDLQCAAEALAPPPPAVLTPPPPDMLAPSPTDALAPPANVLAPPANVLAPPAADAELALDYLQRAAAVQRLLTQQMVLFDHLSPRSFLAFRPYLGSSSGSESAQFHALQVALGLRGRGGSPVYTAFCAALERAGLTVDELYRHPSAGGVLYRVAEVLVDISEGFWQLAAVHVQIAERTIGHRRGTAGTSGADYLAQALKTKAFPDLWDVRTRL